MDFSHFECFCSNLRNNSNLERDTVEFNACHINQISKLVKKEVNYELSNINCDKSYFLNYHLTEIGTSDQYENFISESFNAKLIKYNTTFEDILNKQVKDIYFNEILNTVYYKISDSNPYKESAKIIQQELNDFVISYFRFDMINFIETKISIFKLGTTVSSKKLKWIGKPSQLGFIIRQLVDMGYIEAPLRNTGEINYTQFAKRVITTFDVETKEDTLIKYLNFDSEKSQSIIRKFDENGFNIPHINRIS